MEAKALKSITSQVYRRFPEVAGSQPKVKSQAMSGGSSQTFVVTFRGTAATPDGKFIPRIVRVTATAQGKILKVSTSR